MFRLLLVLNLVLGIFMLNGSARAALPDASTTSILVFGDSLSAAYGIPQQRGWVSLLQQRLQQEGRPYQVANASISGETTSGGLSRIAGALQAHRPDILLIELGANDGLRGLPIADMQNNLKQMIEAGLQAKARVVLVGMMIPPNYGPRYTSEFNETYIKLAKQYKLPLVPFLLADVAGKPELNQDDRLHPTADAQPLVLENVWKILKPELTDAKVSRKQGK